MRRVPPTIVDAEVTQLFADLTAELVESDPELGRDVLSGLDLRSVGSTPARDESELELAVWNATGDIDLATLFRRAAA